MQPGDELGPALRAKIQQLDAKLSAPQPQPEPQPQPQPEPHPAAWVDDAAGELRRRVEGHEERLASLRACRKEYEELSETLRTLPDRTSHVSHPSHSLPRHHTQCPQLHAVVGSRRSWCRSTAWG